MNSGVRFPGWKTVRFFLRKTKFRDGRRPSRGPDALSMCLSSILHSSERDGKIEAEGQPHCLIDGNGERRISLLSTFLPG